MRWHILKSFMPRLGLFGRSMIWLSAFLILSMIIVQIMLISGIAWLNSAKGEAWLKGQITTALKDTQYSVEFSGLHYTPLSSIGLKEVSIAEGEKTLIAAKGVRIHVGLLDLAAHTLSISLTASELTVYQGAEEQGKALDLKPFSLPDLYITSISIDDLSIQKLNVNKNGENSLVLSPSLKGNVAFQNQKIEAELSFKHGLASNEFVPDGLTFKIMFDPQSSIVSMDDISFSARGYQANGNAKAILKQEGKVEVALSGKYYNADSATAEATIQITGTQEKLDAEINGNSEIFALMENGFGGVEFKARAENITKKMSSDIEFKTSYKGELASLNTKVSTEDKILKLSDLKLNSSVINLSGDFDYATDTSRLNAKVKALLDNKNIDLIASTTINPSAKMAEDLSGTVSIDKTSLDFFGYVGTNEMSLAIKGKDISLNNLPLSLPDGHELSGKLSLEMLLKGAPSKPAITGDINVREGRYAFKALGLDLRDITAQSQVKDDRINLINLKARDTENGTLEASGSAGLDIGKQDGRLSFQVKNIKLVNSDNSNSLINANIDVSPAENGLMVSGTIAPKSVHIKIPEGGNSSIPELNIQEAGKKSEKPPQFLQSVFLNLLLDAPNQIFVRGWGLDAEFGGKLKISGTASEPDFQGSMQSIRGKYEEFGKRFALKKANLRFAGTVPPYPYLDIVAETKTDTILGQVLITGPVNRPSIDFASEPALPRDEVLAQILFGKDMSKISPFQAVQLARTLARFTGKGGGATSFDPLGSVRGLTGLDDLRVELDDAGAASVGAGKYLTDKVYMEFETGAGEGSSGANIQIELTPSIRIESEIGQDAQGGAGIFWNRDY